MFVRAIPAVGVLLPVLLLLRPAFARFPPGAPSIIGPVSPASTLVQVTNLVPGALEVIVSAVGGAEVARGPPDVTRVGTGVIPVTNPAALVPGSNLIVKQRSASGWSFDSPAGLVFVTRFADPRPPTIASLLHTCMSAIRVDDVVVGAEIQIFDGTTLLATTRARDTLSVWVDLPRGGPLLPGVILRVAQQVEFRGSKIAGAVLTDRLERYDAFLLGLDTRLKLGELSACRINIPVVGGVPGTGYSIDNDGRFTGYYAPSFVFNQLLSQPLVAGNVEFQQHPHPGCERSAAPQTFVVKQAMELQPPSVSPGACGKSEQLSFSGLVDGGTLVVAHTDSSGNTEGFEWGNGDGQVPLPPGWDLADGSTTFYQTAPCGMESPTDVVWVGSDTQNPGGLQFIIDLYECSRFVLFKGGLPNAITTVLSVPRAEAISTPSFPQLSAEGLVIHTPKLGSKLVRGDVLSLRQDGCGGPVKMESAAIAIVNELPERLQPPSFDQDAISEISVEVKVKGVLPGALVTVFVGGTPFGQAEALTDRVTVPLTGAGFTGGLYLPLRQLVTAIQSFDCDNVGNHSSSHTNPGLVVRPAPT